MSYGTLAADIGFDFISSFCDNIQLGYIAGKGNICHIVNVCVIHVAIYGAGAVLENLAVGDTAGIDNA